MKLFSCLFAVPDSRSLNGSNKSISENCTTGINCYNLSEEDDESEYEKGYDCDAETDISFQRRMSLRMHREKLVRRRRRRKAAKVAKKNVTVQTGSTTASIGTRCHSKSSISMSLPRSFTQKSFFLHSSKSLHSPKSLASCKANTLPHSINTPNFTYDPPTAPHKSILYSKFQPTQPTSQSESVLHVTFQERSKPKNAGLSRLFFMLKKGSPYPGRSGATKCESPVADEKFAFAEEDDSNKEKKLIKTEKIDEININNGMEVIDIIQNSVIDSQLWGLEAFDKLNPIINIEINQSSSDDEDDDDEFYTPNNSPGTI